MKTNTAIVRNQKHARGVQAASLDAAWTHKKYYVLGTI